MLAESALARSLTASLTAAVVILAAQSELQAQVTERVRPNDNRARAGLLASNTLVMRLEARLAVWHPDGDDKPGMTIPVFAEQGRAAQVPGPLIRVPGGTEISMLVRNLVPNATLTIHGLHSRPAIGAAFNDSIQLAPGAVQALRFRLDRPGTYYYWGTTSGRSLDARTKEDAQLTGVIVVDDPGQRQPHDRILVIGMFADTAASETTRHRIRELFVINGRSYPNTDKLSYQRGEQVRWRVINASADAHAMHLHGFFFRVTHRGNGRADAVAAATQPNLVTTEQMDPGSTMSLTWTADRLGNWIFHCGIPAHSTQRGPLGYPSQTMTLMPVNSLYAAPMVRPMGGLVTPLEIVPAEDDTTASLPPPPAPEPARRVRMVIRPGFGSSQITPYYGVGLDEVGLDPATDTARRVGPPLLLDKGDPVSIMVINRSPEPTSIHWHGIELESQYDGVPDVSGVRPFVASPIAPGDSFEVRFTPQRAGTFFYHSHVNEARQERAGIVGALIVSEKGKYDPAKEFPVVISSPSDSTEEERAVWINGSSTPPAIELRRAVAYRFRMVNITTGRPGLVVSLRQDSTLATWRQVAKDGADLPAAARGSRPAQEPLGIDDTMDVEFFPTRPGDYHLEARSAAGTLLGAVKVRVQ